jgi:hypothetical protein
MRLKDKVALVTGASSGIGRAIAELEAAAPAPISSLKPLPQCTGARQHLIRRAPIHSESRLPLRGRLKSPKQPDASASA